MLSSRDGESLGPREARHTRNSSINPAFVPYMVEGHVTTLLCLNSLITSQACGVSYLMTVHCQNRIKIGRETKDLDVHHRYSLHIKVETFSHVLACQLTTTSSFQLCWFCGPIQTSSLLQARAFDQCILVGTCGQRQWL